MPADRYLRTGTTVPVIYPGTLAWLLQAMQDAQNVSAVTPGQHFLEVVNGPDRDVLQVYENGTCTYYQRREDGESVS